MFPGDKFVTPLYRMKVGNEPELGASGVWLAVGNRRFLVTAAHVVDEKFIWFPMQQGFRKLPDFAVISNPPRGNRNADKMDVAIFPLTTDEIAAMHPYHQFVGVTDIDVNLNYVLGDRFEFTGFPYRGARLIRRRRLITQRYVSIIDRIATQREYKRWGYSHLSHIFMRYVRRKMLRNGVLITGPKPHGMSGGGIWKLYPGTNTRKLAGIAIETPGQFLVGTRITLVLEVIRTIAPALDQLIPRPQDVSIVCSPTS
jgi:hypothetical protein